MFLRNCWYIAAFSSEILRSRALPRTLLNEKVVLFRTGEGRPIALEDRCPHRFAPLSVGRLTGTGIACGYHGMEFDTSGRCIANPTQPDEKIPPHACVRAYPVEERHGMIWIWMGDTAKADAGLIPDYKEYDDPAWNPQPQYMHVKGNYLLLVDNLLDLSHINFVHGGILGSPDRAGKMEHTTEATETGIAERWLSPASPIVPIWDGLIREEWGRHSVDLWADMYWQAPSNMMLDTGVTPAGKSRTLGAKALSLNCVTPETATTTHYFYGTAGDYWKDRSVLLDGAFSQRIAFQQDEAMIEAVQANMGQDWDILAMKPVINKADRAALQARRIVRKLIDAETEQQTTAPKLALA